MFPINKREQIWDEMVIHVNKSSLSYQEICKHYIEASDTTSIANGTGNFLIVGARLFLQLPILIVKPTYVGKLHNNVTTEIHEFKCTKEDKSIDQRKCAIILVYNGLNYYAAALPPALRELYYKKSNHEKQLSDMIMKYQEIQQMLPTSDARANMDSIFVLLII